MKITETKPGELTIEDNIKSIDDSIAIKEAIAGMIEGGSTTITLRIVNSFAMPSAVIGNLMKLVHQDNIKLHVQVGDQRLYDLLDELQLIGAFGVHCKG